MNDMNHSSAVTEITELFTPTGQLSSEKFNLHQRDGYNRSF